MYLIYCYTNKENGKKYIGITSRSMEEREANHIYESRNKTNKCYNAPFKRAIRKYGIEGFEREIIDTADSLEKACELEKFYIKKYNSLTNEYEFVYKETANGSLKYNLYYLLVHILYIQNMLHMMSNDDLFYNIIDNYLFLLLRY